MSLQGSSLRLYFWRRAVRYLLQGGPRSERVKSDLGWKRLVRLHAQGGERACSPGDAAGEVAPGKEAAEGGNDGKQAAGARAALQLVRHGLHVDSKLQGACQLARHSRPHPVRCPERRTWMQGQTQDRKQEPQSLKQSHRPELHSCWDSLGSA